MRQYIAESREAGTSLPYTAEHIIVTCGAGGALNVALKALLDPGDEVVTLCPYFVEYDFYAANHGGKLIRAETGDDFQIDLEALEAAITPRTRAVIVNSPNNPTGVIYPEESLRAMGELLRAASGKHGRPIVLLADEPYRPLVFDGLPVPATPPLSAHPLLVPSHSPAPGPAGEAMARDDGSKRIFLKPPDIGGRDSGLSLFGLVPASVMGMDLSQFLDAVDDMRARCESPTVADNPGAWLGGVIAGLADEGMDKVEIVTSPSLAAMGLWTEQLIAESLGKSGKGVVPVAGEPFVAPSSYNNDRLFVYIRLSGDANAAADRPVSALAAGSRSAT